MAELTIAKHRPLYREVLGADYDRLPALIQEMHDVRGRHSARGRGRVQRSSHLFGRLVAELLAMPAPAQDIPVETSFTLQDGVESITRNYNGSILITHQAMVPDPKGGAPLLLERFGPMKLFIRLEGTEEGITFHLQRCKLLGLPLPRFLSPSLNARERVTKGKYHYFVQVGLPLLGRLIEYEGFLDPPAKAV